MKQITREGTDIIKEKNAGNTEEHENYGERGRFLPIFFWTDWEARKKKSINMNENEQQKTGKNGISMRISPKSLDVGSNGQFQQYMTFFGIYHTIQRKWNVVGRSRDGISGRQYIQNSYPIISIGKLYYFYVQLCIGMFKDIHSCQIMSGFHAKQESQESNSFYQEIIQGNYKGKRYSA